MFEDYTTDQLIELRDLCAHAVEYGEPAKTRADALAILDFIDQELTPWQRKMSA